MSEKQGATDRRRSARQTVEGADVKLLFRHDVRIRDIGLRGVGMETRRRLVPGRGYRLRLWSGEGEIELVGTVVWCRLHRTLESAHGERLPLYRAGVRFEDLLEDLASSLLGFIEERITSVDESRVFNRVRLESPPLAKLEVEEQLDLVQLSATGLGAELAYAVELDSNLELEVVLDGRALRSSARVADVERHPGAFDRYRIGLEFLELKDVDREAIVRFLEGRSAAASPTEGASVPGKSVSGGGSSSAAT